MLTWHLKILPLEKEVPIGNRHFWGQAVIFRECTLKYRRENH